MDYKTAARKDGCLAATRVVQMDFEWERRSAVSTVLSWEPCSAQQKAVSLVARKVVWTAGWTVECWDSR